MNTEQATEKYVNGEFKLKTEFESLHSERSSLIQRCEKYAGYTLPSVFPRDTLSDGDEIQHDYQSVGAKAVTNLANKIMMALFQPSKPFFRMSLTEEQKQSAMAAMGVELPALQKAIAEVERKAAERLTKKNGRVVLTEAIILLIICGNSLMVAQEEQNLGVYNLRDYVLTRNPRGDVLKLIIKEKKKVRGLEDKLAELCTTHGLDESSEVDIYTCAQKISEDKYIVWQELNDIAYCHKRIGIYSKKNLPWIPLTWNLPRGADYGNGLVENYAGDFHTLSTLAEVTLDFSSVVTDVKNLVNPAGMTDVEELQNSRSGDYVTGREEDLFCYTPNIAMAADFIINRFDATERRIGSAFLMNSMVTRDAERVTAEEIRMQAQELESSLGGVYSRLAVELQQPLANRLMAEEDEEFGSVEPVIVTGLETLSRMSEVDRLRAMLQDAAVLSDLPERLAIRLKYNGVLNKLAAGHGVDTDGIIATEEEVRDEQRRQAQENAQAQGAEAGAVAAATGQV